MSTPPIYAEMTARRLYGDEFYPSTDSESSNSSLHDLKVRRALNQHGLCIGHEDFVKWQDEAPQLPRNWTISKKAYNDILICFFEFWMTTVSSSGVCTSLKSLQIEIWD